MSHLTPCKRKDFIKKLSKLGFESPKSGTRHQFMIYQEYRLSIPSNSEYSIPQLRIDLCTKLRKTVILSVNEESSRYFATLRFTQYDNQVILSFVHRSNDDSGN